MRSRILLGLFVYGSFLLAACGGTLASSELSSPVPVASSQPSDTIAPTEPDPTRTQTSEPTELSAPTALPEEAPPRGAAAEFSTDFSKHTVPYSDILSGGPPKDGIPPVDEPQFITVAEADAWLEPVEPVVLVQVGEQARAYPLQILMWHEIVNDTIGDLPLSVTFCPLCNTAIAFERDFEGHRLDFGTTGRLRFSNLIMYDRQTETWWQQGDGVAIAGEHAGSRLSFYPATIISWQEFKSAHPDGEVLSRETGFNRRYGSNPYTGYDDVNNSPFLYRGPETPGALPPVARVLSVDLNGEAVAYPYLTLETFQVVNDVVGGQPVVVFWAAGTASALDAGSVAGGRDVGSAAAYSRELDGRVLTFELVDGRITDQETGSQWNLVGQAVAGELAGSQLEPVVAINHFWFSWAAFRPETRIYQP